MSRIHEALKRAEMELPILGPSAPEPRSNPEPSAPKDASYPIIEMNSKPAMVEPAPLEFEQLLRTCPHFQRHVSPTANVFEPADTGGSAEQFRSLRSKLYQIRSTQPLRTLLITSASAGEGKTFVLINLAQAIVRQPGRHVLVIDADLRRSNVHKVIGSPSTPGLAEYLRGEADEFSVIHVGDFGLKSGFCLIPAGGKVNNPTELLSSGRMKVLLNRVTPAFDWVIIDSPPCVPVADASILAGITDGLLFVLRAGATPSNLVQKARQELPPSKLVGVLLNATENKGDYTSDQYRA